MENSKSIVRDETHFQPLKSRYDSSTEYCTAVRPLLEWEYKQQELQMAANSVDGVLESFEVLKDHPEGTFLLEIRVANTRFWNHKNILKVGQLSLSLMVQSEQGQTQIHRNVKYFKTARADEHERISISAVIEAEIHTRFISKSPVKLIPIASSFMLNTILQFLRRWEEGEITSNLWLDTMLDPKTYNSTNILKTPDLENSYFREICEDIREECSAMQIQALHNGMQYPLSVINGPAGTGKTFVLASIMVMLKTIYVSGKAIAVAKSNFICDGMAKAVVEKLKTHLPFMTPFFGLRVYSKKKELYMRENNIHIKALNRYVYVLHQLVDTLIADEGDETLKILLKRIRAGQYNILTPEEKLQWQAGVSNFERRILGSTKYGIIICTLSTIMDRRFKRRDGNSKYKIDTIVLDDASSVCHTHSLPLLGFGQKRIIFAYDDRQSVVSGMDHTLIHAHFNISSVEWFKKVNNMLIPTTTLDCQYRMGKIMHEVVTSIGYPDQQITCLKGYTLEISAYVRLALGPCSSLLVYDHEGTDTKDGLSYYNQTEVQTIRRVCERLNLGLADSTQLSVLTMYRSQRDRLNTYLQQLNIKARCSESMAGLENQICVISMVRAEQNFKQFAKRLTLMLSRSNHFVVVVLNKNEFANSGVPEYIKMLELFEGLGDNRKAADLF